MHLRVGITEAGKNVPVLDNLTAAYPAAMVLSKGKKYVGSTESFVGKSSIEVEATDSQTGELLAAAVDRRGGGKYAWKGMHRWGDVEEAYTYWAKQFAGRACMMRGDATCELPKE
jgi:hypothetical protein